MPIKRTSMEDIAKTLGLSIYAVSIALSGKKGVSEETRRQVNETAKILGYKRKGKSITQTAARPIVLVTREFDAEEPLFFSHIVKGIQDELEDAGYSLTILSVSKKEELNQTILLQMNHHPFDGAIIMSDIGYELIHQIHQILPTVLLDHIEYGLCIDTLMTDNIGGVLEGMNYLFSRGHSQVGFIGVIPFAVSYEERFEGYKKAYHKRGVQVPDKYCYTGKDMTDRNDWEQGITNFLDSLPDFPQAFIGCSDWVCALTVKLLNNKGLRIPQDISLLGFDDSALVQFINPPLTMVHIHKNDYGARAAKQLLMRIENLDKRTELVYFRPQLIVRESVK